MSASGRRRAMIVGFLGAVAVLAALFWLVGAGELVGTLVRADPEALVLVVLAAGVWFLAWSLALRTVLAILDVHIGSVQAVLIFAATVFANNVTPFGQAGGEPLSALLISRVSDSEYEAGLAAMVSLDALKLVPPIGFALAGLAYYAATLTLPERLETVGIVLVGVVIGVPIAGLALWRRRDGARVVIAHGLAKPLGALERVVPRWRAPDAAALEARVGGFFGALEQVADAPRRVAVALSLTALGWLGLICCLWLSLVALGYDDPRFLAAAFVVIPLGSVAAATPFPGGLGGMEAAFVAVLTPFTGLPAAATGAAVVLYRLATYWLPTVIGAAAASAFGTRAVW